MNMDMRTSAHIASAGTATPEQAEPADQLADPAWRAAFVFLAVTAAVFVVVGLSAAHLPWDKPRTGLFPGRPWLQGWVHWDAGWYFEIAERGYSYVPGRQGPVAFFPAYPLLMRGVGGLVGSHLLAGILVTLASGLAVTVLFFGWARARLGPGAAWTALLLLVLYPYSYYLIGAVYADGLFVAALVGAFALLDRDRPVLAGLAGALATAARPVGLVLVPALVARALERRGALTFERRATDPDGARRRLVFDLRRLRPADAGVLLSLLGVGVFCFYLWRRFGDPFAFATIQREWDQGAGPETWLKFQFFDDVQDFRSPPAWLAFVAHPLLTVGALSLVPRVVRRFGWAYGLFTALIVVVPALSSKNFFGMSRYLLAAFPCFAVGGELLAARPRLRAAALAMSAVGLLIASSGYATGHYLT